ncbi:hypothetical protein WSM22_10610 [Cytophagales bacterium WSM2-2]|nr:hypothetical protein WSM22_10610 [Cytophagales bacterium WSM2-2]
MKGSLLKSVFWRNALGIAALLIAYFIPDRFSISERAGFAKFSPYLLLLLMYGWIAFHNRILFERLYLEGKKRVYFLWAIGLMIFSSVNMHLVIVYGFDEPETLSKILSFWVFTITGLGIYVIFKYQDTIQKKAEAVSSRPDSSVQFFSCFVDGLEKQIPLNTITHFESLENYVRVFTQQKILVVRLSLKEAEQKLPKSFLRISRSHIVNTQFVESVQSDSLKINGQIFKIGKVYKRYVESELAVELQSGGL